MDEPLRWPSGAPLKPSNAERRLKWVPVIGWIVGSVLEQRRLIHVRRAIFAQLESRQPTAGSRWGRNEVLAAEVCSAIQRAMSWPNQRFIPEDPMSVLLSAGLDGCDADDAILDSAGKARVRLTKADGRLIPRLSLGEFVELLASRASL